MEIERKFLTDGFPSGLPLIEEAEVRQGYLATDPVVRIRSKRTGEKTTYVLCFKGQGTLVREEVELPLDEAVFDKLAGLLKAPLIHKRYQVYALPGGERLEVSLVDEGTPGSFIYAEVEFGSVEEARSFAPPPFLGREVTEERGYSMGDYWLTRRLPDE